MARAKIESVINGDEDSVDFSSFLLCLVSSDESLRDENEATHKRSIAILREVRATSQLHHCKISYADKREEGASKFKKFPCQ